jgi:hypothetical protein
MNASYEVLGVQNPGDRSTPGCPDVSAWRIAEYLGLFALFLAGLLGVGFAVLQRGHSLPGDLGDARLNIYLLEHVFRWVTGQDASLWTAPLFYGYSYTFAFSSNHLGSFPFYFMGRIAGLDRETAFQVWYAVSFLVNFAAAVYVLLKLRFSALAAGAGAFIFTFGLPILAQVGHPQLLYRFCVPPACYLLLRLERKRGLAQLWGLSAWLVWQMCIEVYTGVFLFLLLAAMAIVLACRQREGWRIGRVFSFWPKLLVSAWQTASTRARLWAVMGEAGLTAILAGILWPYFRVTRLYGFKREWAEIETMIPRLQSYFLGNISHLWRFTSTAFAKVPMAHEQQMFVGAGAFLLAALGVFWKRSPHRSTARVSFLSLLLLFVFTLHLGPHSRYTPYRAVAMLPGFNAIRAVSRIIVVMLWPVGVLSGVGLDVLWRSRHVALKLLACLFLSTLFLESWWTSQFSFAKAEAAQRLDQLQAKLPGKLPDSPVLLVFEGDPPYLDDLDAMLLSQSRGWSTLNGYTGNAPPGWHRIESCFTYPRLIARSLAFNGRLTGPNYQDIARRVVPLGFDDCPPESQQPMPSLAAWSGPLPAELLRRVRLRVVDLIPGYRSVRVQVEVFNGSSMVLPSVYRGSKAFYVSGRLIDATTGIPVTGFDVREELRADVLPGDKLTQFFRLSVPRDGRFIVETSAVQELVAWTHDHGAPPARSAQAIESLNGAVRTR